MKVLVCDQISDDGLNLLKENKFTVDVKIGLQPDELKNVIKDYEVVIVRSATKLTKDIIDSAEKLKLIVRGGVGLDNIDAEAAKSKNITVLNTPEASTITVAEHTMALLLALTKNIAIADKSVKEGKWEKKKFKGIELYNKTLGLIGVGRIGSTVAKIAKNGFQMKVLGYDPYVKKDILKENGIEPVNSIDELLQKSDIVSLHLPLTPETKNLINRERINKMKDGAIIVNCARGGIIDETALAEALKSGKLWGAALDVFENEPPKNSPLLNLENVVLTPHIGAATKEAQKRVGIESAKTIINFFKK